MLEYVDVSFELDENLYAIATALCLKLNIKLESFAEVFFRFIIRDENYEFVKAFIEAETISNDESAKRSIGKHFVQEVIMFLLEENEPAEA